MRKLCLGCAAVFFMGIVFCLTANNVHAALPEEGYWRSIDDKTEKTTAIWQLIVKDGALTGYIVNYKDMKAGETCTACKGDTAEWTGKPILGTVWMKLASKGSNGAWENGYIVDSETGKKYKAKVWVEGEILKVRGYIGFVYSTQSWKRATKAEAAVFKY